MPIPNNTIEFLTSERNKQTPPYRGFYDEAIAALESGWISVEDRLPECNDNEGVEVIAFIKGTKTVTAVYYSDGEFFDEAKDYYKVTHWMPLPEPPKGKKNGQKK